MRVRRIAQAPDDGYRCDLVGGLKAGADAERLADELAFSAARLDQLAVDPPGLYADAALLDDREEAVWLVFLVALLCPLEDEPSGDPFAAVRAAHVPWSTGELPRLQVARGPRPGGAAASESTVVAYRAWAQRAGGQGAALDGERGWSPERRFERVFDRLALPGLERAGRYELLVSLSRVGLVEARATSLRLGDDPTTTAAKRVFGIGDTVLLERRARALAEAAQLPIEALDLALFNWGAGSDGRATYGASVVPDPERRAQIASALRL